MPRITNEHRPSWPAELCGQINWQFLADQCGRHLKHITRAAAVAVEILIVLQTTQPKAWDRVNRYIASEVARRVQELAERHVRETLAKRYGVE